MTANQDIWPLIQSDIFGLLAADALIGARPGVLGEPGDIQTNVDLKLAKIIGKGSDGKSGVGWCVPPIERAEDEDLSSPFSALKLLINVEFYENVTLNRAATGTQIPLRVYAARAAKILKLYTPVNFTQSLVPRNPVISEFTADTNKALRMGLVAFQAREADDVPLVRLNRPMLTVAGTDYPYLVTATFDPRTLAAYYTTDGSHPYAGNPKAQVYSAPVSVTEPGLFRVRAFGADDDFNTIASDTAAQDFV